MPGSGKMTKTKASTSGGRKLASGAGRKPKSGGEPKKHPIDSAGKVTSQRSRGRTGSSKQRKS